MVSVSVSASRARDGPATAPSTPRFSCKYERVCTRLVPEATMPTPKAIPVASSHARWLPKTKWAMNSSATRKPNGTTESSKVGIQTKASACIRYSCHTPKKASRVAAANSQSAASKRCDVASMRMTSVERATPWMILVRVR